MFSAVSCDFNRLRIQPASLLRFLWPVIILFDCLCDVKFPSYLHLMSPIFWKISYIPKNLDKRDDNYDEIMNNRYILQNNE